MDMLPLQGFSRKAVSYVFFLYASHVVRRPALDDASAFVVIESGIIISGHTGSIQTGCNCSCQQSFAAFRIADTITRWRCDIVKRRGYSVLADERVVIIVIHCIHYRIRHRDIFENIAMKGSACIIPSRFHIDFTQREVIVIIRIVANAREYRTIQFIAKRESPFSTNTLLAILRKHLVVAMIVNVIDGVTLRKFLVNTAVQEVIVVGITTLCSIRSFGLIHLVVSYKGRINIHQIIVVVIFIISETRIRTVHASRQNCTSESIFKLISLIPVFIGSTDSQEIAGGSHIIRRGKGSGITCDILVAYRVLCPCLARPMLRNRPVQGRGFIRGL
ncbi:hypothetical protein HMPREF0102_00653 [Bacteroides sp. 2_1_22]|nr:hypothetical protein HMPREF0102_00653 [Bacteroides sp. 2_1_22]